MQNNKYQSKYKGKEIDAAIGKIYNNDFPTKEYVESLIGTKIDKNTGKTSEIINDGDGTSPFATQHFVTSKMAIVYKYKGSVLELSDLPTECEIGDVYNVVNENGKNFAWTGTEWDDIGGIVDLSEYTDPNLYTDENIINAINKNHQSIEELSMEYFNEISDIRDNLSNLQGYINDAVEDIHTLDSTLQGESNRIDILETQIGDISTALDDIISLQEQY